MAICSESEPLEQVSTILEEARTALSRLEFSQAEKLIARALSIAPASNVCFLLGKCFIYQGRFESAADALVDAWELGKQKDCLADRWRACFALAQVYRELHDETRSRQFRGLGIAAAMQSLETSPSRQFPEELLLESARFELETGGTDAPRATLEMLFLTAADRDLRAAAGLLLLPFQDHSRRRTILFEVCRIFRRTGNLHQLMLAMEQNSRQHLRRGDWEAGRKCLLRAKRLAEKLSCHKRVTDYGAYAARLSRCLSLRFSDPSSN